MSNKKANIKIRETRHIVDRQDVINEFIRFLTSNTVEARMSIENILMEGFIGLEKMNNNRLAREFIEWQLHKDLPNCDCVEIKTFK